MKKLACLTTCVVIAACGKETPPAPAAPPFPPPPAAPPPAPEPAPLPVAATPVAALPAAPTATKDVELSAPGTHFVATWKFPPPKVGALFAADLTVSDPAGKPVPSPKVTIDVTMPAHGHGMMTDPDLKQVGPTRWHADGLKLHMHGTWQFDVRIESAGVKERVSAVYEEPPEATDGL